MNWPLFALAVAAFGIGTTLLVVIPSLLIAASSGVWLFYIQHQFEETHWSEGRNWDFQNAALNGSSHYDLPRPLRWITGNIGIHHVHHLAAKVPFYRLPDVLRDYADRHGFDQSNWVILTKQPDQAEDTTRLLARDFGLEFTMTADSDMMMHGAVTHVLDIGGRFAAKFHGMEFKNVNLILYVSELINNAQHRRREPSWWDRLTGVFQ